jgi:integrase
MAGAHFSNRLTALKVKNLKEPGKYEDGGGLRCVVWPSGSKSWVVRITVDGRRIERGVGSYRDVSLDEARRQAELFPQSANAGIDLRAKQKQNEVASTTFRQMFEISFAQRKKQLSNAKHLGQWESSMAAYVHPMIGDRPVADVTTAEVIDVLTPIWVEKAETARRVLQSMETVFKSAIVRGIRERASPCVGVSAELGAKRADISHHASMPWSEVPDFVAELREPHGRRLPMTALALEFLILTATRSGETRGALWSEIDLKSQTWIIPKERMKARMAHRVPLCSRCIEILRAARVLKPDSLLVFAASRPDRPLSDMTFTKLLRDLELDATAHGLRSSFKVWCAEVAKPQHEVSEAALAHTIPNKVVAAYLRTDFFEERRGLMTDWATHCLSKCSTLKRQTENFQFDA